MSTFGECAICNADLVCPNCMPEYEKAEHDYGLAGILVTPLFGVIDSDMAHTLKKCGWYDKPKQLQYGIIIESEVLDNRKFVEVVWPTMLSKEGNMLWTIEPLASFRMLTRRLP